MSNMKLVEEYAQDVRKIHVKLQADPGSKKLKKQLKYQLREWSTRVPIIVRVAKNETKPWGEAELSIPTFSMDKKVDTGFNQVGDYHFEVSLGDRTITGGLVVERKEVSDLYGTLMRQDKRERFDREIDRFRADPRFDQMTIMVEGTMEEFLDYVPEVYVFRWDTVPGVGNQRLADYLKKYYKLKDIKAEHVEKESNNLIEVNTDTHHILVNRQPNNSFDLVINGHLKDHLYCKKKYGKENLYQLKGSSRNSKLASIAKLETNDTHIQWCGSREQAIELYPFLIKQWLIRSYVKVLGIEG